MTIANHNQNKPIKEDRNWALERPSLMQHGYLGTIIYLVRQVVIDQLFLPNQISSLRASLVFLVLLH